MKVHILTCLKVCMSKGLQQSRRWFPATLTHWGHAAQTHFDSPAQAAAPSESLQESLRVHPLSWQCHGGRCTVVPPGPSLQWDTDIVWPWRSELLRYAGPPPLKAGPSWCQDFTKTHFILSCFEPMGLLKAPSSCLCLCTFFKIQPCTQVFIAV